MASERERADVRERRRVWIDTRQPLMRLQPGRLVFIDETWAKTNMGRTHGRAPRGERAEWSEGPPGERPQLKQQARAAKQQKPRTQRSAAPCAVGDSITGKIASVAPFGVFIEVGAGPAGWLMDGGLWQEFFCCLHCPCCILPLRCTRCLLTPCPL